MSRSVSDADIQKVAKLTGVPYRILRAQVGAESGGRQVARSSKGASGVEQLMPSTARYVARKYGVNTNTPYGNLLGGAYYLKEQKQAFGNWRLALAAYNAGPGAVHTYHGVPPFAETEHYVRDILTKAGAFTNPPGGAESASPAQTPSIAPGGTSKLDTALQGLGDLAAGEYNPTKELQALQKVQESTQKPGDATQVSGTETPPGMPGGKWQKFVSLSPSADRNGVHTQEPVMQFVGRLGIRVGRRLTIGTGTNHNEYTVNGNVSDHWRGMAADIPASGAALTRLGRLALIQAGMSRREALKIRGGLFNVGGYQIIFNTTEGGNHFNHLHVGIRG